MVILLCDFLKFNPESMQLWYSGIVLPEWCFWFVSPSVFPSDCLIPVQPSRLSCFCWGLIWVVGTRGVTSLNVILENGQSNGHQKSGQKKMVRAMVIKNRVQKKWSINGLQKSVQKKIVRAMVIKNRSRKNCQ